MTIAHAVKKLGQLGTVQHDPRTGEYWTRTRLHVVSFLANGRDEPTAHATCFHVKRVGEVADSQTDYFPGSFFKNLTRAIRYAATAREG